MKARVEKSLGEVFAEIEDIPATLADAIRHGLFSQGKRLRPILCITSAEAVLGAPASDPIVRASCALEFIHAYSLVHDDLPAMDNDELRRGEPTVWKKFGEVDAILAGDALNTEAAGVIARSGVDDALAVRAIAELTRAAGAVGMVAGQHLDLAAQGRQTTVEELEELARRKTGALITASCVLGGILAGGTAEQVDRLRAYGRSTGLAFQIADDLLDVEGDEDHVGKGTGKDQALGKATFPSLLGIPEARRRARALVDDAIQAVMPFGKPSEPLIAMARFVVDRTR